MWTTGAQSHTSWDSESSFLHSVRFCASVVQIGNWRSRHDFFLQCVSREKSSSCQTCRILIFLGTPLRNLPGPPRNQGPRSYDYCIARRNIYVHLRYCTCSPELGKVHVCKYANLGMHKQLVGVMLHSPILHDRQPGSNNMDVGVI